MVMQLIFKDGQPIQPEQPLVEVGGGPPYDGNMNARIEKLEAFASETRDKLAGVVFKLDHIEKEVGQFKWWIVAQIVAGVVTVIGTGIAVQQMTVSTFVAAGAHAKEAAGGQASQPTPAPPSIIINNIPPAPAAQQPAHRPGKG